MKNTMDIVSLAFNVYKNDAIASIITGGIYKSPRPIAQDKEDIVIGSLPVTNEQLQKGIINVNVHVPNLKLTINVQDFSQPNYSRLNILTDMAIAAIDEKYFSDYWFIVQQQSVFTEDVSSFSNIRVEFYSENIS